MRYQHAVGIRRYTFASLRELLAKASPARSGDYLAGVAVAWKNGRADTYIDKRWVRGGNWTPHARVHPSASASQVNASLAQAGSTRPIWASTLAAVARKGDPRAGAVLVKAVNRRAGTARLYSEATRGDGETGEDVTQIVLTIGVHLQCMGKTLALSQRKTLAHSCALARILWQTQ